MKISKSTLLLIASAAGAIATAAGVHQAVKKYQANANGSEFKVSDILGTWVSAGALPLTLEVGEQDGRLAINLAGTDVDLHELYVEGNELGTGYGLVIDVPDIDEEIFDADMHDRLSQLVGDELVIFSNDSEIHFYRELDESEDEDDIILTESEVEE